MGNAEPDPPAAGEARPADGRRRGWRAVFGALTEGERRDLREILAEHYADEVRLARQLAAHADGLGRYPDRRARLLEIAAREEEHARWLREALERLGSRAPARVPSPPDARTNWERLIGDLETEKEASERLLRDAFWAERDHPDIARLLERISEEERRHQRELIWLLAGATDRVVLDRQP
jgi:rubrerythrin